MKLFWIEALRRITTLICLLCGVWMTLQPAETLLLQIKLVDFDHEFSTNPFFTPKNGSLEDFIRKRTAGRTQVHSSASWLEFARAIRKEAPQNSLQKINNAPNETQWIYRPDDIPSYDDLPTHHLQYIHIPSENTWIVLNKEYAHKIHGLDNRWAYPDRSLGLALLAAAFLIYFFFPRVQLPENSLTYSRRASVVLPDMLGLLGGSFFFALPILILAENAPGQYPWAENGGWHLLTYTMWLMGFLFLLLAVIGFFYSTLYLTLSHEALAVNKGLRKTTYVWEDMANCTQYKSSRGRIIGLLLTLFANNPGMIGQGLLVASNIEHGVEIHMKNTKKITIMGNAFPGFIHVIEALRKHQIKGASNVDA